MYVIIISIFEFSGTYPYSIVKVWNYNWFATSIAGIDIDDDHYNFKFLSPFINYYYISISIEAQGDTGTIG